MNLRMAFLAILAVVILVGSPLATRSQAETLIDFTDTNPDSRLVFNPTDTRFFYGSWTQTVPTDNVAIGAIISRAVPGDTGTAHAWLMNQVGPGTTTANQIAAVDFIAPYISGTWTDLTTAPYTTLFTGLSLSPGTYYLVFQGPAGSSFINPYNWLGDLEGVTVNTAAGFTVEPYAWNISVDPYVPASEFYTDPNFFEPDWYAFYRVEGDIVPLPPTIVLLGSGLLGLAGWRRFRKV